MTPAAEILAKIPLYTDNEPYAVLKLPAAAITAAASIIAEIGDPFCALIADKDEVTLVIPQDAVVEFAGRLRGHEIAVSAYRLITFDGVLPPDLTGFMAMVSSALADAGIPIFPYAAYSRDHLLIPEAQFEAAMTTLRKLQTG